MLLPLSRWSWLVKESRQSKPGRRGLVSSALVPVLMSLSDGLSPVSPRNPFLPGVDLVGVLSQQLKANWERRKGSSVREDSGQSVDREGPEDSDEAVRFPRHGTEKRWAVPPKPHPEMVTPWYFSPALAT